MEQFNKISALLEMMQSISLEEKKAHLVQKIVNATNEFSDKYGYHKNVATLTEEEKKAIRISRLINNFESGYQSNLRKLCGILGGGIVIPDDVPSGDNEWDTHFSHDDVYYWVSIVPEGNDNSHSYTLDVPVLKLDRGSIYLSDVSKYAEYGNNMTANISMIRPSTEEEINAMVDSFEEEQVNNYFNQSIKY